jgi:hypothetical protein
MTKIIEPWAEIGQTKEQFIAYLLDLTDKQIAEAERGCHPLISPSS